MEAVPRASHDPKPPSEGDIPATPRGDEAAGNDPRWADHEPAGNDVRRATTRTVLWYPRVFDPSNPSAMKSVRFWTPRVRETS